MSAFVEVVDWGLIPYGEALARQRALFEELVASKGSERARGLCEGHLTASGREQNAERAGAGIAREESHCEREERAAVREEERAGWIVLCEHPHVYTLGKNGREENLLVSEETLRERGAEVYRVERGGDVTYHGPGQLVGYPILDLEQLRMGLREYIEALEQSVIDTVKEFGTGSGRAGTEEVASGRGNCAGATSPRAEEKLNAERAGAGRCEGNLTASGQEQNAERAGAGRCEGNLTASGQCVVGRKAGMNGVWVKDGQGERKICAVGVRSSRFVTMHGFALNVSTDLGWFELINPCGLVGGRATSMNAEVGTPTEIRATPERSERARGCVGGISPQAEGIEEVASGGIEMERVKEVIVSRLCERLGVEKRTERAGEGLAREESHCERKGQKT